MFDLVSSAYAMGATAADGGQPNAIASLLPFALMFVVLYLLILRPQMKKQKSGRIVVVSSITGPNVGWPGLSHYMASKGGANAFIRGASLELAKYNITVNGVSPGSIMTEGLKDLGGEALEEVRQIIPAGYIGEPDDIAYALLYLASDQARYVTGQILVVDGGQILPESPTAMADA